MIKRKINIFILLSFLTLFIRSISVMAANLDDPTMNDLQTPIENVFNIAVSIVGIALVAMLAFGIWKSSMSLGDPRGLEGAKQTWAYAFYGFAVIVIFFILFSFLAKAFNITTLTSPKYILKRVFDAINELLQIPQYYENSGS